jgi:hypothetical protein
MIVWGGFSVAPFLNTGGRYDPSTDAWTPTSTGANVPPARYDHTAVWTGKEMIVWGGNGVGAYLNTGGRYNPSTDTWTPTESSANVPSARYHHSAVWTGTEMIVWGGYGDTSWQNSGGRYDPSTNAWTPTSIDANVPSVRGGHTAVWTGTEMIVWGGGAFPCMCDGPLATNTGGRYDPLTDTWTPTSTGANVPIASGEHTAVWTGTEMIVWGGISGCSHDDLGTFYCDHNDSGGRYEPSTDTWTAIPTGLEARSGHAAVWTGAEMIIWGGVDDACSDTCCGLNCEEVCQACYEFSLASGGRYDPSTDSWTLTSSGSNVPSGRASHTAVWTGTDMLIWGGSPEYFYPQDNGGLYCACPNGTLYYRDADGDGYGDPGAVGTSCDGTIPAGYVANHADCSDTSSSINPGALELCNAVDDDCDGAIDNAALPGPVGSLALRGDARMVEWAPVAAARTYDVVFGDLGLLRSSGGNFTTATLGCVTTGMASTSVDFAAVPAPGQAFWVLVRGDNCAGNGTYDGETGQVGSRDTEIDASPYSCGHQPVCGDGACNGPETCGTCPGDCLARYLDEDFSDNSAGWTLGYEWQIGPAEPSQCAEYGADDPDSDHSTTDDDGVAGVVLGGCAATAIHDYTYLESPPFDASGASTGLMLSFYRWLNSDAPPFMTSDVEVWNGSQWVAIWTQPGFTQVFDTPIAGGPGWNLNQFDLTPYKNAAMKVRFGVGIGRNDVYSVGSWNIDDVLVASCQ